MAEKHVVRVIRCEGDMADTHVLIADKLMGDAIRYQQCQLDDKLRKRMDGRERQFFYATLDGDGEWKLGAYAPYQQDW